MPNKKSTNSNKKNTIVSKKNTVVNKKNISSNKKIILKENSTFNKENIESKRKIIKSKRKAEKLKRMKENSKKSLDKNKKMVYWKPFVIAILLFILSLSEFMLNGESMLFWILFTISIIVIIPNIFWLKLGLGVPFGLPFIATMLKTKYFIKTIQNLSKHARILEIISILGLFLGFGLAGIDYWVAREKGGIKRIIILLIGAIGLYIIFKLFLEMLFMVPALAPILLLCLISFILIGLGGLTLSILVGYGFLSVIALFSAKQIIPQIYPVIPGVSIPGIGVIVPFIAWISLGLILIIHEFSHGILLVKYKEKLKSVGVILLGIFPMGAFVEQDDKTFIKKSEKKQILVLSAGPSSNLFTMAIGFIILLLFTMMVSPIVTEINNEYSKTTSGVRIASIEEQVSFFGIVKDSPAKGVLFEGDEMLLVNDSNDITINNLKKEIMTSNKVNLTILRNNEIKKVEIEPVLFEDLNYRVIGVVFEQIPTGYVPPFHISLSSMIIQSIHSIIFFFFILSFAIGMFNFLPSDPLDGGRIAKFVLLPYFSFLNMNKKETMLFIGRVFTWIFVISILLNLLPYITIFLG